MGAPTVLRADLLPLLLRGRLRVSVLGHARELFDVHVFLVAEQLAELALEGLEAHFARRPILRRIDVGGAVCGLRLIQRRPNEPLEAALTRGREALAGVGRFEAADLIREQRLAHYARDRRR